MNQITITRAADYVIQEKHLLPNEWNCCKMLWIMYFSIGSLPV